MIHLMGNRTSREVKTQRMDIGDKTGVLSNALEDGGARHSYKYAPTIKIQDVAN